MKTLVLVFALAVSRASLGGAACDPTMIDGTPYDADADSVLVQIPPYQSSTMGYDFHAGRLFGHCDHCLEVCDVQGSDTYRIQGAPAGVPISIHVELRVVFESGGGDLPLCGCSQSGFYDAQASINSPQGGDFMSICFCHPGTKSIGLDLVVMPNNNYFTILYSLHESVWADGFYAHGQVEATIRFTGVPPGAQLTSCHGVNDAAVAALPETWGHIKARYGMLR